MSTKFIGGNLPGGPAKTKPKSRPEQVGSCVVCKAGIFSDQDYGRAPKPLLGKAHAWCATKAETLAEQFPPIVELESERHSGEPLTQREREILSFIGCGLRARQIADRLRLSQTTVETHLATARAKLGVHRNRDAAKAALDAGLIPVPKAVR